MYRPLQWPSPRGGGSARGVCLPRGCVCLPGVVCPEGGCLSRRGVSAQNGGVCLGCICLEGSLPRGVYTTHHGQTDTCENITFPQLLLQTVKTVQYCRPLLGDQQVYLIRIVHLALFCLKFPQASKFVLSLSKAQIGHHI